MKKHFSTKDIEIIRDGFLDSQFQFCLKNYGITGEFVRCTKEWIENFGKESEILIKSEKITSVNEAFNGELSLETEFIEKELDMSKYNRKVAKNCYVHKDNYCVFALAGNEEKDENIENNYSFDKITNRYRCKNGRFVASCKVGK